MKKVMKASVLLLTLTMALAGCGGGGGGAAIPAAPELKVFVTSGTYDGNLGGLSGADTKCQAEATAAGLSGTYKAWLSTSTVDAYCHIQGYTGTIATNCGQGTLPVAAGPWERTDGFPFAGTIANLINNHQVYTPVAYDATGTYTTSLFYFTGTKIDGTYAGAGLTCDDWTNNAPASAIGASISGASSGWTWVGGADCNAGAGVQLLCMQTGTGAPLPSITAPASAKKVFVTSVTGTGDFTSWADYTGIATGIAAGDQICKNRAAARSIPNAANFKAWLSDGSTNAIDHVMATATGPWYRLDGVKVADNKAALTGTLGPLFTAIGYTEMGTYIDIINYPVWTGTNENGNVSAYHCNGWADGTNGHTGQVGFAALADGNWTNWGHVFCANTYALYCFEDD